MPGASLVAAVVAPDILDAIPGDKEVFFGMLHLECGTTCTKADGIWLIQGQWAQVKDAVMLLDIVERTKNANETLILRAYFDQNDRPPSITDNDAAAKKNNHCRSTFSVEWTEFFSEIKKEFPQTVVDKFKRIVTAAVRKEEESKSTNHNAIGPRTRRPLTRRKGLPHRLKSTIVENPLTTALAIAFGESERTNTLNNVDESANKDDDVASEDSVDSADVQIALQENADEDYSVRAGPKGKSRRKKDVGSHLLGRVIARRDGKTKLTRIGKRSVISLNKILSNLVPELVPTEQPVGIVEDQGIQPSDDYLSAGIVFPSRSEEDHEQVEEEQRRSFCKTIFRCPICSIFTSDSKGAVKIHAFAAHLAASFRCFVCKGDFSSKRALERHRASHRREMFPFLKCLCSRIMTSRSGLTRHIASCKSLQLGAKLVDNPIADATGNFEGFVSNSSNRQKKAQQLTCDICNNFVVPSGGRLVHHKLTQHADVALKCTSCPALEFENFASFYEHNALHVTRLPCETCGKVLANPRSYEAHLRTHDRDFEKAAFVCNICAKAFSTAYVLKYHMQHVHLQMGKRFQCSRCGRAFTQKIHLIEHLYSHDGLKPYICDLCGKGFSHQTSLQQHKLIHGDEQRYKCNECPKSFHTRASLLMHRNCHTERKHQCQYCGKLFTQKTARIRHERIHTGEQPFKCNICSKAFSDSSVLRRHMLTHDPNHSPRRQPTAKKQLAAAAAAVALTPGAIPNSQGKFPDGPLALQNKPRGRNSRARNRSAAGQNVGPSVAPMMPFASTSGAAGLCQPPGSIDSALDLHLFSPMSMLIQQPLNMHGGNSATVTHNGHMSMTGMGIAAESCPSPETPPPISIPDHHAVEEPSVRLYHQNPSTGALYQPQRAHENQSHGSQQYHVIQLPSDAVSIVQMTAPSSRGTSKFSSYLQHAMVADTNSSSSNSADGNLQHALLCSANQAGSLGHSSQIYLSANSPAPSAVEQGATSSIVSSNPAAHPFSQQFFLSSEQIGNGATLFAVPAEAFFGLQSQQPPDSPQQAACSYQYNDMPLNLGSPSVNVQDNGDQQQQSAVSDQILYQSVPAFFTMDGIPISSLNIFNEQGRQVQLTDSSMIQPMLQMPAPPPRPQNAHQRISTQYR